MRLEYVSYTKIIDATGTQYTVGGFVSSTYLCSHISLRSHQYFHVFFRVTPSTLIKLDNQSIIFAKAWL